MNREGSPALPREAEEDEVNLGETIRGLGSTIRRRKWLILVPMVLITVAVSLYAMRLPNRYTSEAALGFAQQQVSERYVSSDALPIVKAVTPMRQQILSRSSLLQLIDELDLYPGMKDAPPEDLAAFMLSDLSIELEANSREREEALALHIAFTADSPKVAQRVTSRVAAIFMEESQKQRGIQVENNAEFLDDRVREAEAKLAAQEQQLQAYKTRNLRELPEQQASNLGVLTDLRARLHGIDPGIDQARLGLRRLETQVSDRLTRLQSDRTDALKRYTAANPAVVRLDGEIAKYGALREVFSSDGLSARARQILAGDDAQITQIRSQAEEYTNDIERLRKQQTEIQGQIDDYQSRVAAAPLREQEQSAIQRDYKLLKEDYDAMKAKQLASGSTRKLEQQQEGQSFHILEPPSLPARPVGPKRLKFSLGAAAAGLVLGLVLVFLRGTADITFRSEKDVSKAFHVPLVLGIPEILTPKEESRRKWKSAFDWVAGTALILVVVSTEVYVYIKG